jgi:hypothetical protein
MASMPFFVVLFLKDIGKSGQPLSFNLLPGCDDDPVAVLDQGPDGMLPAGSAAEIVARHQDGASLQTGAD